MTFTRSSQRRPALPEKSSAAGHALAAQRMESKGKGRKVPPDKKTSWGKRETV